MWLYMIFVCVLFLKCLIFVVVFLLICLSGILEMVFEVIVIVEMFCLGVIFV